MFCSNCGKTLRSDDNVCPHCKAQVGESRFEGQPYTGAQMKTKPGEAVRLPANHTKTTYMGVNAASDSEVDARTTYRATSEQVYSYDETEPEGEVYNEDFARKDEIEQAEAEIEAEEEEAVYDVPGEEEYAQEEEISDLGDPEYEEAIAEDEGFEQVEDEIRFEDEEEKTSRRDRRNRKSRVQKEEQEDEDQELIDSLNDEELEELKETLNPTRKKTKKPVKARRKTEEELLDEEMFEEIRARDLSLDDDGEAPVNMEKYTQSGRYDKPAEAENAPEKAGKAKTAKSGKASGGRKMPVFAFLKKREENFEVEDMEDAEEESFEEITDENAFNLNDLPEMDEVPVDDQEYLDEDISDEELEGIELTDEDLEFDERRKKLSPKAIMIIKYACAAIIVVGVLVGVIMGLSYITEKTKKAPIDGVTYDLYMSGIELMQYRASDAYQNEILSAYDGMASSMVAITASISADIDAISGMMPENPDVNDARFIDALKAIQTSINNSLTNDMLALIDSTKTTEVKEAESAARWQSVRDMVTSLTTATSSAQLDGIIKGERVEVIQQTTPEPVATSTPVPYTTLASGSEGSAVRKLQTRLADLGYLDSEIDGDFGKKTKTAVQLFQQTAGLTVTGIADVETQIALFADDAPKKSN